MSQQIFQARATSYCLLDNVSIFLDRRNDKYHYLDREKTQLLNRLQNGFDSCNTSEKTEPSNTSEVVEELVAKNLLTTKQDDGKALQPLAHESPRESVYDVFWERRFYPVTTARIAIKHATLQRKIKRDSLYETTQRSEKLKAGITQTVSTESRDNIAAEAKRIIDSRYFVYTYKDKCLFDSYLFFEHFVRQGVPVNWVFGVNLYPFAAHCWVEHQGLVLNDQLERVAAYTPIYMI